MPTEVEPISGIYTVEGITLPAGSRDEEGRKISGTVVIRTQGDTYSASFKLSTTFPGLDKPVHADVIGSGEGTIDGRKLTGTTKTQLVISTVPGMDTDFAFIPRIVGARVVSIAVTDILPDGSVVIELENKPDEGEDYRPTRTRLTGMRVADAATRTPPVAANRAVQ